MAGTRDLRVAVIGLGWMGGAHARAYSRVRHHYPDSPAKAILAAVSDSSPGREAAAEQYGALKFYPQWTDVIADPDIDAVSVTVPNVLHREIGCAVLESGKHLWIEKPVGLGADDARAVADAAATAGRRTAVGFNYRNAPAVEAARALIAAGDIGTIAHARFRFLSDYAAHPDGALTWRYQLAQGGHGVLGDLASHGADLVRYLLGDIESLLADTAIFVPERPEPSATTTGHQLATGGVLGPVENEDYVGALMRMTSGARCVLEASRVSVGEQNSYGFEIHGTTGLVRWDYRRMGELEVSQGQSYQDQPISTVHVGPGSGDYAAFQPGAANPMSYDDLKVIEAHRFLQSIVSGPEAGGATVEDAVHAAQVLDAMVESATKGVRVSVAS